MPGPSRRELYLQRDGGTNGKKKATVAKLSLVASKENDEAIVAPSKKKFVPSAKLNGILISAPTVPAVPTLEPI